jgi:hypothetical protein
MEQAGLHGTLPGVTVVSAGGGASLACNRSPDAPCTAPPAPLLPAPDLRSRAPGPALPFLPRGGPHDRPARPARRPRPGRDAPAPGPRPRRLDAGRRRLRRRARPRRRLRRALDPGRGAAAGGSPRARGAVAPAAARHRAPAAADRAAPAPDGRDRAHRPRGRHRRLRRPALLGPARLGGAAGLPAEAALGRRAALPRRPGRTALRDARRVGDRAGRRPARRSLGVPPRAALLRDDPAAGARRARLLGRRALGGGDEDREPQPHRRGDRDGPQLARPRRAADALRHRGAEAALPAAARPRRGDPVLRAHRPRGRQRRRRHPERRRRVSGLVGGPRGARHAPHLEQALHHARSRWRR